MKKLIAIAVLAVVLGACFNQVHSNSGQPKLGFIGDSITVQAAEAVDGSINEHYGETWDVSILGVAGAKTTALYAAANTEAASRPAVVIVNLGTNDAAAGLTSTVGLDTLAATFASVPCVIWVTINTHNPSWGPTAAATLNEHIATFAHVVDWDAAWQASYFSAPDGPHPNATGLAALLDLEDAAIAGCAAS